MNLTYHFGKERTEEYVFEVSGSNLKRALKSIVTSSTYEEAVEADELDQLAEDYEDILHDYFEDDAKEEWQEARLLSIDPDKYYGVSRRD